MGASVSMVLTGVGIKSSFSLESWETMGLGGGYLEVMLLESAEVS